jgi:hypothetical protein
MWSNHPLMEGSRATPSGLRPLGVVVSHPQPIEGGSRPPHGGGRGLSYLFPLGHGVVPTPYTFILRKKKLLLLIIFYINFLRVFF